MSIKTNSIRELIAANGTLAKQDVLKKYSRDSDFRAFLFYALNPLKTYNVSEISISKYAAPAIEEVVEYGIPSEDPNDNIFNWCERLSSQKGISNVTLAALARCLYQRYDAQDRDLYIKMLSKTLRLGVTASTVNKVIPDLIPRWEVQQAFPIEKYPLADGVEFWLTQKLNGVRATYYRGQLVGRSGLPFEGLDHIINDVESIFGQDLVVDGELTLSRVGEFKNLSDNEAFRIATGIINGDDNEHKLYITYTIFDAVSLDAFDGKKVSDTYGLRRKFLDGISAKICVLRQYRSVKILPTLYHGNDQSQISLLLDKMVAEDKEGLMVNLDVPYMRKRHRGILKVKRFYTMDLPILRCEEGKGRLAGTLGNLVVDFCGNEVCVGSGLSDEQRENLWKNRQELEGVLCEVKYKEITTTKGGVKSLQFPIFVSLRTDKTDVSYG